MYYGYARVSTQKQSDTSLEVQLEYLRNHAEELGEDFKGYKEKQSGGSVDNRSVFLSIFNQLKKGDCLGVYDDSRLGRNATEMLMLRNQLLAKGVRVFIGKLEQKEDPQNNLVFGLQSVISQFFKELQNSKSRESLSKLAKDGMKVFAGDLIGYSISGERRNRIATIDPKSAELIRYCYEQYSKGKSIKALCRELYGTKLEKPFDININNIRYMLRRPIYMGYYLYVPDEEEIFHKKRKNELYSLPEKEYRRFLVKSKIYEPIVSEELWWSVFRNYREVKHRNATSYENRWSVHEFSGVYHCKDCGVGIAFHNKYKTADQETPIEEYTFNQHRLNCPSKKHTLYSPRFIELATRGAFFLSLLQGDRLEPFLTKLEEQFLKSKEEYNLAIKDISADIKKNKDSFNNLLKSVELGILEPLEIQGRAAELREEAKRLETKKKELEKQLYESEIANEEDLKIFSEGLIDEYICSDIEGKRKILLSSISKADNYHTHLELTIKNGIKFEIDRPKRTNFRIFNSEIRMYYENEQTPSFWGELSTVDYTISLKSPITTDADYAMFYNAFFKRVLFEVNYYLQQALEADLSRKTNTMDKNPYITKS